MADFALGPSLPNAFDSSAAQYDADFSYRSVGRKLRQQVWRHLRPFVRVNARVLDLGCGTGEDALWLVEQGCIVSARDGSPAMIELVREKAARAGTTIDAGTLDLNLLPDLTGPYDLVLANFGVLNCVANLESFAAALKAAVRPGGAVVLVAMGRFCAWETLWYGLQIDRRAFRRWFGHALAAIGGKTIRVRYWGARETVRAFKKDFHHEATHGIGVFLPPSYLFSFVERRPHVFQALSRLEKWYGRNRRLAWLADHQLTILRRNGETGRT